MDKLLWKLIIHVAYNCNILIMPVYIASLHRHSFDHAFFHGKLFLPWTELSVTILLTAGLHSELSRLRWDQEKNTWWIITKYTWLIITKYYNSRLYIGMAIYLHGRKCGEKADSIYGAKKCGKIKCTIVQLASCWPSNPVVKPGVPSRWKPMTLTQYTTLTWMLKWPTNRKLILQLDCHDAVKQTFIDFRIINQRGDISICLVHNICPLVKCQLVYYHDDRKRTGWYGVFPHR